MEKRKDRLVFEQKHLFATCDKTANAMILQKRAGMNKEASSKKMGAIGVSGS